MAYLLDANVFIEAKRRHYGFDFCPAFWDWLDQQEDYRLGQACTAEDRRPAQLGVVTPAQTAASSTPVAFRSISRHKRVLIVGLAALLVGGAVLAFGYTSRMCRWRLSRRPFC